MKLPALIENDEYLIPHKKKIISRLHKAEEKEKKLAPGKHTLSDFANAHLYYGLHKTPDGWIFREWAPNAENIYLLGAFSDWLPHHEYRMQYVGSGNWEITLPLEKLSHLDIYKLLVCWDGGCGERIPAYTRRVIQDEKTHVFSAQVWDPPKPYKWKNKYKHSHKTPLIYEAHVGMSSEEEKVSTFAEFRVNILPRIAKAGYNTIQLMAIQEHPYYGSFGYHVSSFFAVSFRHGTPEELKQLIDEAHSMGISVIMDIVHSHAVKNIVEGLSHFDGTEYQYFHRGERGLHPAWDSRCFDYSKNEVLHFLLSNCKFWLDEYHFDGFRFDGVTSMIYIDHGLGTDFLGYEQYFDDNQDEDAITYLKLANKLIHEIRPDAITIAEEMSGMPGLASSIEYGGYGFDYRMAMGVPDYVIKLIKETKDEFWHVGEMFWKFTDKRKDEKIISYAECHDQALVGDQTIIFRLIGPYMYSSMHKSQPNILVDRGVALHKMLRLFVLSCAGNGYLNFMGNEFGHPEWIDFPRAGNNWSFKYARRLWSLCDSDELRYSSLNSFDRDMIALCKKESIWDEPAEAIEYNNEGQVIFFKRGSLYFVFNFNPVVSFTNYGIEIKKGNYKIVLNSDSVVYSGHNRINDSIVYKTEKFNKKDYLPMYIPSQCCFVIKKTK